MTGSCACKTFGSNVEPAATPTVVMKFLRENFENEFMSASRERTKSASLRDGYCIHYSECNLPGKLIPGEQGSRAKPRSERPAILPSEIAPPRYVSNPHLITALAGGGN